ncbi:hypothetical protein EVAR_23055_1 [Eumeta japonica]|uniref:Uncharacterized protein n=1 Tax=Eumeta variegata TaxID=151549 RepID=A0A4C1VMI1_EUMVA|nr:hypothetical protein EVAR_23055_1 [Eumeta japonica]
MSRFERTESLFRLLGSPKIECGEGGRCTKERSENIIRGLPRGYRFVPRAAALPRRFVVLGAGGAGGAQKPRAGYTFGRQVPYLAPFTAFSILGRPAPRRAARVNFIDLRSAFHFLLISRKEITLLFELSKHSFAKCIGSYVDSLRPVFSNASTNCLTINFHLKSRKQPEGNAAAGGQRRRGLGREEGRGGSSFFLHFLATAAGPRDAAANVVLWLRISGCNIIYIVPYKIKTNATRCTFAVVTDLKICRSRAATARRSVPPTINLCLPRDGDRDVFTAH